MELTKVTYSSLNPCQKENINFQKVSAVLAEYGFVTFASQMRNAEMRYPGSDNPLDPSCQGVHSS